MLPAKNRKYGKYKTPYIYFTDPSMYSAELISPDVKSEIDCVINVNIPNDVMSKFSLSFDLNNSISLGNSLVKYINNNGRKFGPKKLNLANITLASKEFVNSIVLIKKLQRVAQITISRNTKADFFFLD